ncbi:5156_t:CDS:10 [Ambispora gerdemannii]|uniref:5156_t:CDS:1 n=1 Tax=Ambispora gerdemannii TaxID=144530 RepID=A0A9N8VRY4_9GLOM|nr:5156_t:CDS:10 [Ambispora gerdemannii]
MNNDNTQNPAVSTEYTGHVAQTTVARYAPSGYYIASGDVHGNVRIWDTTQAEQILKNEVKVIAGKINDIAWDSESKRIIAVGNGKERYGHAFSFDTGSSVGEISGHSKVINSVDIRQHRPFRAATASDDFTVVFYQGAPYKFAKSLKDHTGFVQGVKFSPDGEKLVSVGSDKKTGEKIANLSEQVGDDFHKGGIYAVSWSPDNKKIFTSSADKSAKIWDVEAQKILRTFEFPDSIENQQIGNLWLGEYLVSLSLSGDLNYLDEKSSSPVKVIKIKRCTREVTMVEFISLYITSFYEAGAATITGQGHTNQVIQFASNGNNVYSTGMDDTIRKVDAKSKAYSTTVVPTGSLPKGIAVSKDDFVFVATIKDVQVFKDGKQISSLAVSFTPGAIAVNHDGTEVAVGGEDIKVRLYKFSEEKLAEQNQLSSNRSAITALAYSPDGTLLASGDSEGKIYVYNAKTGEVKISNWGRHTGRIYSIAWSPDGLHVVSGSLDTNIYVWSVEKPTKSIAIKGAHKDTVTGVTFLDDTTISSVGQDASLKLWTIAHH